MERYVLALDRLFFWLYVLGFLVSWSKSGGGVKFCWEKEMLKWFPAG